MIQTLKKYARKLGILGGMGPEATASLYLGIINRCQRELSAKYNSDFPPIIINSCPVPDGKMWKGFDKTEVERVLRANVRILEKAGVDFIAIPCNSVHHFLPLMRETVHIPILSIVEETARAIKKRGLTNVLLFATEFTMTTQIFDQHLEEQGIQLVKPSTSEQRQIQSIIIRIESGRRYKSDREALVRIIRAKMKRNGIQGIVAGCTEIPLLIHQGEIPVSLFDTIDVLAASAYALIRGKINFDKGQMHQP